MHQEENKCIMLPIDSIHKIIEIIDNHVWREDLLYSVNNGLISISKYKRIEQDNKSE